MRLDGHIYEMIKKKRATGGCFLIHRFFINYNNACLSKDEFLSKSFLNNFYVGEREFKGETYIDADVYIIDSSSNLYTKGNAGYVGNFIADTTMFDDNAIIQAALHDSIEYLVYMSFNLLYTIGIKGENVFVFDEDYITQTVSVYRLEDFIDCCWDKFLGRNEECPELK